MAQAIHRFGILPFDTDDSSVLFRSSLKSASSVTGAAGTTGTVVDNGGIIFDEEKGVTTTATNNRVLFEDATLGLYPASIQWEGQLSFEIEKEALWTVNAGGPNLDNAVTGNVYFATWTDSIGGSSTPFGKCFRNTNGNDLCTLTLNNAEGVTVSTHQAGNGSFVRVTISWIGERQWLYIDGRMVIGNKVFTNFPDMFKYFYVGSDRGSLIGNEHLNGWYERNLIVASRSVQLVNHPKLINVGIIGDSFVTAAVPGDPISGVGWDKVIGTTMSGYFANLGLNINITYYGNAGATITDGTGDDLQTEFANAIAAKLDYAFVIGGLNDTQQGAGFNESTFDTDYRDHLNITDGLMSVAAKCWVCTITTSKGNTTSDIPLYTDNRGPANTKITELTDISGVEVIDLFDLTGGDSLGFDYWEGELTGALDNLHPSTVGHKFIGNVFAENLLGEIAG